MRVALVLFSLLLLGGWTHGGNTYEGLVATRAGANVTADATKTQAMSRSGHFARDAISSIKVAVANFYGNGGTGQETALGAAATVTASIEYPAGTCAPVLFSGASSVSVSDGGTVVSDFVTVSIPNGAKFWVRQFYTNANGVIYNSYIADNANMGDALNTAASGLTDLTVSCASVTNAVTGINLPLAIIARTAKPTVCIVGDSIAASVLDNTGDATGDHGIVAPSIGPSFGYANLAIGSDAASTFLAHSVQRQKIFSYCSHSIVQLGRNDFGLLSRTVNQLKTDLTSIYNLLSGKTVFQTTIIPSTTTTDGCATTVNQTVTSWEANRVSFNAQVRAATFDPNGGMFDTNSVIETATDSGLWKVSGACTPWAATETGLCVHPGNCADLQVKSSGVIDTSELHRP